MKKTYLLVILCIATFSTYASSPEEEFWEWFERNESEIYAFETADEPIFNRFSKRLELVNREIGFEFSGIKDNGKRELTISAGGIASNIDAVENLYAAAPNLKKWELLKFKQRKTDLDGFKIGYQERMVEYKDVKYKVFKDDEKLGVVVFFKDYNKDEYDFFAGIAFLFLDLSLGEFDVMTKMGFLEIMGDDSTHFESAKPLKNIIADFDGFVKKE